MRRVLSLARQIRGDGEVQCGDARLSVAFSIEGAPFEPGENREIEFTAPGAGIEDWHPFTGDGGSQPSLRGRTLDSRQIYLPEIHAAQWRDVRLSGFAFDVRLDRDPLRGGPSDQAVRVYLTPTGIPLPSQG